VKRIQYEKTSIGGKVMRVRSVRIPEEIDEAIDYVARSGKIEKTSA
jgi:hypothetical protein